jgi:hypothetical protein
VKGRRRQQRTCGQNVSMEVTEVRNVGMKITPLPINGSPFGPPPPSSSKPEPPSSSSKKRMGFDDKEDRSSVGNDDEYEVEMS